MMFVTPYTCRKWIISHQRFVFQALPSEDERVGVKHPGLMLKYSTFKNLASMAATRDDLETAMEFYLEVKNRTTQLTINIYIFTGREGHF